MTRTLVGESASGEDEHDSVALFSIEDLHPDASSTVNRGSSTTSEGANSTTARAIEAESSEGARLVKQPAETATRSGRVSVVPKQININAFSIDTYMDEKDEGETSVTAYIQAMTASANPDILYYHEAMKAPDKEKFMEAMEQEVKTHSDGRHWEVIPRSDVPSGKKYFRQYGPCAGSDGLIHKKCTNGRRGSMYTEVNKYTALIIWRRTHR